MNFAKYRATVLCSILLIIGIIVRIGYANLNPVSSVEDTVGYLHIGQNILSHPSVKTIINPYRTPVYPVFIASIASITGHASEETGTKEFGNTMQIIGIIQSVLAIISLAVLFLTLCNSNFSFAFSFVFCLLQMINPLLFVWERVILTESIAISLEILTVCVGIALLKRPTTGSFILITILCILEFLLRPAFVLAPLGIFFIVLWHHKKARVTVVSIACCAICMLTPLVYSKIVEQNYGFFEIQTTAPLGLFGKILYERIPVEAAKTMAPLYSEVKEFRMSSNHQEPFTFFQYFNITNYNDPSYMNEIKMFNTIVIGSQLPYFILQSFKRLPVMLTDTQDIAVLFRSQSALGTIFRLLFIPMEIVQNLSYGILVFFPFALIRFLIKKTSLLESIILFCGTFAVLQLLVIFPVQQTDARGRYLSVYFVPLTFFCLYWWKSFILFIGKKIKILQQKAYRTL